MMNWGAITVVLVVSAILEVIGFELVRSIVHQRRKHGDGLGGTQDIAMWGTLIGWVLIIAALITGSIWLLTR